MDFSDLNLNKQLLNALTDLGLKTPTAIQRKVFSPLLAGKDIVGISQTGTGKTYAYLLPTLRLWKFTKSPYPQILIVVPTRELVTQVLFEVENLTTYMNIVAVGVYGGANIRPQKIAIEEGCDIVIGTLGRLLDLIKHGSLNPKKLNRIIIDEVDEMLNIGLRTQLKTLADFLPKKRQHMMFSATLSDEVEKVINEFTTYYTKIETAPSGAPLEHIKQIGYPVDNFNSKANLLVLLLEQQDEMKKVLVFAKTRRMADALYERLELEESDEFGIIHSFKSQNKRFETVSRFHDGSIKVLIATDIIARGLDVSDVSHVVNFDLPSVAEKYIHRIGRTGRSDQKGTAIAFISDADLQYKEQIEALMNQAIEMLELPTKDILSDELIELERPKDYVPYDIHKVKKVEPSGPAFHEKLAKNMKTNKKVSRTDIMREKYGKPIKRKPKYRKKK